MSRLAILASLLLMAVAASAYKTTITTVEIDGNFVATSWKRGGQGKCTQKLQTADLKPCEQHIAEKIGQQEEEGEEDVLRLRGLRRNRREDHDLEQCCEQLRELKEARCQCQAFQQIMQKQSEEMQGREGQEVEQELMKLPKKCGLPLRQQLQKCELRSTDF